MPEYFDEMTGSAPAGRAEPRPPFRAVRQWLDATPAATLASKRQEGDLMFQRIGITFNVYGDSAGAERLIPFDIIPRVLSAAEWRRLARGLEQRVRALNLFLRDVYHDQEILQAAVVPADHVLRNGMYRPEMRGVDVAGDVYVHIAGIDLVRVDEDRFYVLEDNLRTPSGVSYMLENRAVMMRLFPQLFASVRVAPVD